MGAAPSLDRAPASIRAGLFAASFSAIYLEVSLMRLIAVSYYSILVYSIIGVALLGYGAAGAFLAVRGTPSLRGADAVLGKTLLVCSLSIVPCFLAANAIDVPAGMLFGSVQHLPLLLLVLLLLTIPFVLVGLGVSITFAAYPGDASRLYFADLLGAGAGCALAVLSVPVLGGVALLAVSGVGAALGAALVARDAGNRRGVAVGVALANLALLAIFAVAHPFDVRIASDKHGPILARQAKPGGLAIEFSRWSAFGRVDVTEAFATLPPQFGGDVSPVFGALRIEQRMMMLDGAAPAFLYRVPGSLGDLTFLAGTSQSPAYSLRPRPRVLVIGVGGATDVLIALALGATHVTAVEINPVNVHAVRRVFGDYVGRVLDDRRVETVVAEGRNFVARDSGEYDVIQLSGVDTGAASGAFGLGTMPESYIYTTEAITDLLARLAPNGVLTITRDRAFGWSARLAGVAAAALREANLEPATRLVVLEGRSYGWATILVKREPFDEAELAALRDFSARYQFPVTYDPQAPAPGLYDRVVRGGITRDGDLDLRPSTDDWPFFFFSLRLGRLPALLRQPELRPLASILFVLFMTLTALSLMAAGLIAWPLWRLRSAWAGTRGRLVVLGYFGALGAGFMVVEVGLMQRFTIFLGNPVLAIAVVLAALLVTSGVGSWVAGRLAARGRPAVPIAICSILVALVFFASPWSRDLLRGLLHIPLGARICIAIALVTLAGLPMGVPFPLGLSRLAERARALVPWAWGINAMTSVVMSLASYCIGMASGYTAMFVVGMLLYASALVLFRRL